MLRLYANENFPVETVHLLRALGYDIKTTHESGKSNLGIPDEEVLEYAISDTRAVITINRRDFIRLHKNNRYTLELLFVPKMTISKISLLVFTKL